MSCNNTVDKSRRRFLTGATGVVGAVGAAYFAVPFLASWHPSALAQAAGAPVEVDVSKLEPGALLTVEWRGRPVWIVHRTKAMITELPNLDNRLRDPDSKVDMQPKYAANTARAIKPEFFVAIGICTHLGCVPMYRPDVASVGLGADWKGGFFCPCHGSKFDLAGRVFKDVPAPKNLEVPPYRYVSDNVILVGESEEQSV